MQKSKTYFHHWNQFDEMGLLVGLKRIPRESNIDFRSRIINREKYNSTKQGLINFISQQLYMDSYNVTEKKSFSVQNAPLSRYQYDQIIDPDEEYFAPQVITEAGTFTFDPSDDEEKIEISIGDITWYLWKNIDYTYSRLFTTNSAPSSVVIKYQVYINSDLYVIEESNVIYSRDEDGNIISVVKDED